MSSEEASKQSRFARISQKKEKSKAWLGCPYKPISFYISSIFRRNMKTSFIKFFGMKYTNCVYLCEEANALNLYSAL